MTAFDGNEYRKRVMARLLADFSAADPEAGDPFFVVDIDPGATDAQIRERLTQVKAFWQKERNSPKYKAVAAQLVQRYPQYEAVLLDARARGVASARVQGQRGAADAEGIANLDRLAAILARKHQGVPRSKVPLLTAAADRRGVSPAGFAAWLKSITIIDIIDGSETLPWDKGVRTDVRTALDELARTTGDQRRYTTLWTFLGVTPSVPVAQLTRVHERLLAENQAGRQDRIRTRTADLLAHVKTRLLVDGGAESYAATMRADARDLIVPEVEEIGLLAGELGPAEAATLQARIASLGWGITPAEANELVLEVSRSLGIASLVDVDFVLVVCAKCGKAQQAGTRKTCKYCRADLYISCPRCAKQVEAAAHLCPYCNVDIAGQRKRQELIAEATDALSHGQPVHARQLADKAHELSHGQQVTSGTPDALAMGLHALRTDITTRLEAADAKRAAVKNAINTHHWWAAAHDLDWLMREASDVSPDFPAQRELVAQHQADALARLSTVAREHPQDEAAAAAIVRDFPDCVAAADRLASFPLEAPSHFGAQVMDETVHLSWSRVPGRDISYVIKRTSSEGEKVIARTSSVSVEDGGAPTGDPLTYAVSAVSGKRSSPPVAAEPVVLLRDITAVSWRDEDSAVLLTWPPLAGKANVLIERTTDDPAEIVTTKRMRAKRGANTHVDPSAIPGRDYQYRVYPEYLLSSNERVALNGASVNVHLALKAKAVTDFHVSATLEGTALNYPRVDLGTVRILVGHAAPTTSDTAATWTELSTGGRFSPLPPDITMDRATRGQVVYVPVTVLDEQIALGPMRSHFAAVAPSHLRRTDEGRFGPSVLVVTAEPPRGVTEVQFCWTYGAPAARPDDPKIAYHQRLTRAQLQAQGGARFDAPNDGRSVFVRCFPVVPNQAQGDVVANVADTLAVRAPGVAVQFRVSGGGLLRKRPELEVVASVGFSIPNFVVNLGRTRGNPLRTVTLTPTSGLMKFETDLPIDGLGSGEFVVWLTPPDDWPGTATFQCKTGGDFASFKL